ncbi:MAG TPA: translation initiation factor IF-2 [Mobilitalea sp.]|nr:translation initiation factor IF-2 [Mobilitalea sp.]
MQGNQRPAGQGMPRPQGDGGMAQRPMGSGQGNMRQGQPGQTNPQGSQGQQMGQRPAGDRNQQGGMRQGQPGQRPQNYQAQPNSLGQRATGQSIHQGQQVQQVQQGTRSMENQGGMRNNQTYQNQQGQQMQQGQRPMGDRNQGYQGQRPMGDRNQQGGMRQGGYQGQQGQRPAGDRNQQGGMRQGGYQGQQGQRPMGDRNQQDGYQGQRPNGQQGYQGQGQGGYQGGQRPYNNQQGGVRAAGVDQGGQQRQGYQGQRPYGDRNQQGGPRTEGQGGYQNRTPRPYNQDGRPQGGNRPAGQGGYSRPDNRTGGQGGYSRPDNRTGGQGGYSRPDNRTGGQGGYSRPDNRNGGGQRTGGGYNSRGFEDFQKDEDDKPSYGNRTGQGAKKGPGRGNSERKNFDQQILDQKVAEKNDFSNKRNRDRINKEKTYKEKSLIERQEVNEDSMIKNKLAPKKGQFIQPKPLPVVKEDEIKTITLPEVLTIKELADKMKMPSAALVKKLFLAGKMVSINSEITYEEAEEIALEYDIISEKEVKVNEVEELLKETEEDPSTQQKRPPVVCVMGHVDHGKTSLLDAIRETNVTSREAGGITQHIGAYVVEVNGEKITFLDTPGHEAFTAMRMRGAQATDIAILVVAADDGVMPQTVEAISHAKAAGVQIIVAINKIDKPSANIERVKKELTEYELIAEDWGGDTIFVPVSAHTKEGIEQLLEMILLAAEMKEVKANPDRNARGIIIEAELDKGRGPVATILVQKGTLHIGDNVAVGASYGKVRAMMDDKGRRVKEATPSMPVEILGLNEVPDAGEIFIATDNEKEARTIADAFITQGKEKLLADTKAKLSLDGLFSQIQAGNIKELNLIIKADVQGSVEAMKQSLVKLSNDEVAVRILHGGVGAINESDVILASTSNAIIIGFNVKPDNAAKDRADREKVDVKLYRVIYNAIDDIEAAMKGMLDPIFEERIIGHAEVRMTFKASGVGTIAGSYVLDGKIQRGCKARIYRDNELIYEGILSSLKRFQDDVKEVATGYECGLVFEKFNDVKEGDKVELYIMAEVPR